MAFTCSVCEKSYTSKGHLARHQKRCTTIIDKPFHCTSCPASYTSNRRLQQHITAIHSTLHDRLSCSTCSHPFADNYTTPPNITSAHHVPVPSSVSTLSAYTKNHASQDESVQPPPLYQHHQNDKGVVGSHLSGQLYGTTLLYTGFSNN